MGACLVLATNYGFGYGNDDGCAGYGDGNEDGKRSRLLHNKGDDNRNCNGHNGGNHVEVNKDDDENSDAVGRQWRGGRHGAGLGWRMVVWWIGGVDGEWGCLMLFDGECVPLSTVCRVSDHT